MQRLLAAFATLAVCLTGLIAWSSLRMNSSEIAWQLQKQEFIEGNLSRMYLVARFVDQRKLYLNQIDRKDVDRNEFEISRNLGQVQATFWSKLVDDGILDRTSLKLVNTLRHLIGKSPIADQREIQSLEYLELAFSMEREREYAKALQLYDQTKPLIHDPLLMGVLLLHQGFCHALLGEIPTAKLIYQEVISSNRNNDQGVTASLLLQHLDQILSERELLVHSEISEREKARLMPMLMQCKDALRVLDTTTQEQPADRAEVFMERGLCEEEVGSKAKALQNYIGAIKVGGKNTISQDANRRIYLLGTQVPNGKRIQAIATKMNQALGDTMLDMMQREKVPEVLPPPPSTSKELPVAPPSISLAAVENLEKSAQVIVKTYQAPEPHKDTVAAAPPPPKPITPPPLRYGKVMLKNGKAFIGEILSAPTDSVIRVRTMIGILGVRRDEVREIKAE